MDHIKKEVTLFSKFSLVGIFNTFLGFSLIFFLMKLGLSPYMSNMITYSIGIPLSFFLNKRFVFRSTNKYFFEFIRFALTAGIAYFSNFLILHCSLHVGWNPYLSQILGAMTYTGTTYLFSRLWTFNPS